MFWGLQKKVKTALSKAKKQDITGPDDRAVKAKAQVVEEVKKEVRLQACFHLQCLDTLTTSPAVG